MLVTAMVESVAKIQVLSPFFVKSIILKRNNTIDDPEFKQALSDLNPDVIYEKLKVICKRNPKKKVRTLTPSSFQGKVHGAKWPFLKKYPKGVKYDIFLGYKKGRILPQLGTF